MTLHGNCMSYSKMYAGGGRDGFSVDAVYYHLGGRHGQCQGGVAEHGVLQLVGRQVLADVVALARRLHEQNLGQPCRLADGVAATVGVGA